MVIHGFTYSELSILLRNVKRSLHSALRELRQFSQYSDGFNSWQSKICIFPTMSTPIWGPPSLLANEKKWQGCEGANFRKGTALLPLPHMVSWYGA
jgi:hypothetical protein